jgi:hypothetical protein
MRAAIPSAGAALATTTRIVSTGAGSVVVDGAVVGVLVVVVVVVVLVVVGGCVGERAVVVTMVVDLVTGAASLTLDPEGCVGLAAISELAMSLGTLRGSPAIKPPASRPRRATQPMTAILRTG